MYHSSLRTPWAMSHGVASRRCLGGGHRCTSTIGCAGAAPLPAPPPRGVASGAHPLTLLSSLRTTTKACSPHVSFSPPYGWVLCHALPLLAVSMVAPPYHFLGAALRAALGCLPGRRRPAPKRGVARPAPVLLRAVLPPCKASQETAGGLSGVKASALRCAAGGGAWARAGV